MMTEDQIEPTPEATARRHIIGTPVVLSDGREWLLASTVPAWGPLWDQLHDQNVVRGRYEPEALMVGGVALLLYNYRLSDDAAGALILGGDLGGIRDAVEAAMFGPAKPAWTYSDWVLSSLASNGLKLEDIPDGILPAVLDQLVMMGRAVPESKFVASTARAARRGKFFALAAQQATKREASASVDTPPATTPDA